MLFLLNSNILFYIFLLKSWNLTQTASIYYNYNNNLDNQDYWNNYESELKREINEATKNEEYYPQNCKTPSYLTTTTELSTTTTTSTTYKPYTEDANETFSAEAQDVIDHIIHILKSMREHAIGLFRNMNELEMNILSTSPPSNLETLCKNSTIALSESMNGRGKIIYPDVLYQTPPGHVTGDLSFPLKLESMPEAFQTNDFVAEAQQAVKSWKQQIEICKHILENAVRNALQDTNLKSNNIADSIERKNLKNEQNYNYPFESFKQLTKDLVDTQKTLNPSSMDLKNVAKDLEEESDNSLRRSTKHKYQSLYDAFHIKGEN